MAKVNVGSRSLGIEPITQSQFLYYFWLIGYGNRSKYDLSLEKKLVSFLNQVPIFIAFLSTDTNIQVSDIEIKTESILDNLVNDGLENFDDKRDTREYVKNELLSSLKGGSILPSSKVINYKALKDLFSDCDDWANQLGMPMPEAKVEASGISAALLIPGSIKNLKVNIRDKKYAIELIGSYLAYFTTDLLNETEAPWYYSDPYFQALPFKKQLLLFVGYITQQLHDYERNVVIVDSDDFIKDDKLSNVQVLELLIFLSSKGGVDIESLEVNFLPTKSKVISYRLKARVSLPHDFYGEITEETKSYDLALSFRGAGTAPIVRYKNEEYELPSMQADNNPFLIINYCLNKAPGEYVKLQTIKTIPGVKGVSNINEVLKNSVFGSKRALHIFVDSSAKSIKVKNNVPASQRELEAIKKESVRQKS